MSYGYGSQFANRRAAKAGRGYYPRRPRVEKPAHLTDPALLDRINALAVNEAADEWTRNFCASIAEGFKKYKGLTQKQFDIFVKQEHRATPEFAQARDEWRANYDESKRNIARVCAEYYKANPPYFGDLADKVLTDPSFIPTPRQYRAMCENNMSVSSRSARVPSSKSVRPLSSPLPRAPRFTRCCPWVPPRRLTLKKGI